MQSKEREREKNKQTNADTTSSSVTTITILIMIIRCMHYYIYYNNKCTMIQHEFFQPTNRKKQTK